MNKFLKKLDKVDPNSGIHYKIPFKFLKETKLLEIFVTDRLVIDVKGKTDGCRATATFVKGNKRYHKKTEGEWLLGFYCEDYKGTCLTRFLMNCLFYILKKRFPDYYILSGADESHFDQKGGESTVDIFIKKIDKSKSLETLMKEKIFYYERYGFEYYEKKRFLSLFLNNKKIAKEDKPHFFWMNLKKKSLTSVKNSILNQKFKPN